MATDTQRFAPVWDDVRLNRAESNDVIDALVTGRIKMLELFECDPELFERIRLECVELYNADEGQDVVGSGSHPTALYVAKFDPRWKPKAGTIYQYSLYNSRGDVKFNDEDSHWHDTRRRFNSKLSAIPEFVTRYFGDSELQNFRMQGILGGGDLGLHREKIVGIPKRPRHFKLRFHLPVVTNPGVSFMMDGRAYSMQAGRCYLFNQACMHGVQNKGDALRIHLVFDCYMNDHILQHVIGPAHRAATGG